MKDYLRVLLYLVVGLSAVLVISVEGVTNPFTIWNLLPLLLASFLVPRVAHERPLSVAAFIVAIVVVAVLGHLAWLFDWGETATGSSTSALLFVLLPLLALFVGATAWGAVTLLGKLTDGGPDYQN